MQLQAGADPGAHLPQLDQPEAAESLEHLPPQASGMLPLQLAIGIGQKVGHGAFTLASTPSALNHLQGGFLARRELLPCCLLALLLQEILPGAAADPAVVITLDRQRLWAQIPSAARALAETTAQGVKSE